jgi:hypothetical protein
VCRQQQEENEGNVSKKINNQPIGLARPPQVQKKTTATLFRRLPEVMYVSLHYAALPATTE